jgi:hypothetical protein
MAGRQGLTLVLVMLLLASCGGSDEPAEETTDAGGAAAQNSPEDAKRGAGQLLDEWSDHLLKALLVARDRGEAAQASDRAAYARADAKLRPRLREVRKFAPQGRIVMSRYPDGELRRAVVADGDAWQEWAIRILHDRNISLDDAREIADLATGAFVAHERAYQLAGKDPPPAFQRRPDQQ